jgi:hypothetical protein
MSSHWHHQSVVRRCSNNVSLCCDTLIGSLNCALFLSSCVPVPVQMKFKVVAVFKSEVSARLLFRIGSLAVQVKSTKSDGWSVVDVVRSSTLRARIADRLSVPCFLRLRTLNSRTFD